MSERGSYNTKRPADVAVAVTMYKITILFCNTESKSLSVARCFCTRPYVKVRSFERHKSSVQTTEGVIPEGRGSWEKP